MANIQIDEGVTVGDIELIDVDVVNCASEKCYSEIVDLRTELEAHLGKIDELSQQYHDMLIENLKKDAIIRKLEAKLKDGYLNEFREYLSEAAVDELNLVANVSEKDSAFILKLMRQVYKNDLHRLKHKTYSQSIRNKSKTPLTPTKVDLIKRIYEKRIKGHQNRERLERFGKHVKTSIETINKNENRTTLENSMNKNENHTN